MSKHLYKCMGVFACRLVLFDWCYQVCGALMSTPTPAIFELQHLFHILVTPKLTVMRKLRFLPLLVLLSLQAFSQSALTLSNSNLRESASTSSKILGRIPRGTEVYLEACSSGWCKTTFRGTTGYISAALLLQVDENTNDGENEGGVSTQNPHGPITYYTNTAGEQVQSPTAYERPPAGATAQCWDGTYSFSQNRRGTCSHHGGVKKWLQ